MKEQNSAENLERTKDVLIYNRLLGHMRHPTITDVPFGSWTVTLVSDVLESTGQTQYAVAADIALGIGLAASLLAVAGGLADLSETHDPANRHLGAMHGIFQGVATTLYGASFVLRRRSRRNVGRTLGFAAYGCLFAATYLAAELAKRRKSPAKA